MRADLREAHLKHADLNHALGLTQDQINEAMGDADIQLPAGLMRPESWR